MLPSGKQIQKTNWKDPPCSISPWLPLRFWWSWPGRVNLHFPIPVDRMSEIIPYIQRCQKYLLHCPAYSLRNDIHLWLLSGAHLWVSPPLTTHQRHSFMTFVWCPFMGFPPSHNSPIPIRNLHFSHFSASAGKHQGESSIWPGLSTPASFDVHVDRALL